MCGRLFRLLDWLLVLYVEIFERGSLDRCWVFMSQCNCSSELRRRPVRASSQRLETTERMLLMEKAPTLIKDWMDLQPVRPVRTASIPNRSDSNARSGDSHTSVKSPTYWALDKTDSTRASESPARAFTMRLVTALVCSAKCCIASLVRQS